MERNLRDDIISRANRTPANSSGHSFFAHAGSSPRKDKLYEVQALQCKVLDYQRENAALRRELDLKESKLSSCMRSVELFWSPELNKEREVRKLESEKLLVATEECERLRDQLKVKQQEVSSLTSQHENQSEGSHQDKRHRNLSSARLHGDVLSSNASDTDSSPSLSSHHGNDTKSSLTASPGQVAELQALRKTLDEMELRVSSQKSALAQREETIKKLLERLQAKAAEVNSLHEQINTFNLSEMSFKLEAAEDEIASLNAKSTQYEFEHLKANKKQKDLSEQLRQKQLELEEAKQRAQECSSHVASLQTAVEQKDFQLNQLLQMVKDREERVMAMPSPVETAAEVTQEEHRQLEALQSHSKFMKAKIDSLKQEITKKDEMVTEHTKAVTELSKSSQTQSNRIKLLEDTVTAKTKQCERLQRNVQALTDKLTDRDRLLNEYESSIDRNNERCDKLAVKVRALEADIRGRDGRISNLTEEVATVRAGIREKETALKTSKQSLAAVQFDRQDSSAVVEGLEERLRDKQRHIDMLREQRQRYDQERDEESEAYKQTVAQLKAKAKNLEKSLEDMECKLSEAQEDLLSMRAENTRKNTRLLSLEQQVVEKELDVEVEQKRCKDIQLAHQKVDMQQQHLEREVDRLQARVTSLEDELQKETDGNATDKSQCQHFQSQVLQLQEEIKTKNANIEEMERALSSQGTRLAGLRRSQQLERTRNAQLLGQAKRREDELESDVSQLQIHVSDKNHRIAELEVAFKESMEIVVDREERFESERRRSEHAEKELHLSQRRMSDLEENQETLQSRLAGVISQLQDREALIASLRAERQCQTEELMELKQNALLAAISEKDANIALLETSSNREEQRGAIQSLHSQKDQLVAELKEWTQRRVRFRDDEDGMDSQLAEELSDASPDQVLQAIRNMDENMTRLRSYIDQLLAVVLEQNPALLEGMPRRQQGKGKPLDLLRGSSVVELLQELREKERDHFNLQGYANLLLQRIMEQQPSILEAVAALQS